MGKYIYASHMGGYYTSEEALVYDQLYCEECGDSDQLIGIASSRRQAKKLLWLDEGYDDCDYEGSYIEKFINSNWEAEETTEKRKSELLAAAWKLLNKQNSSPFVLNMLTETVYYDEADCDGNCLMDDIKAVLEEEGINDANL